MVSYNEPFLWCWLLMNFRYRLGHRIWQINKIPRDQLEDKLGLDVPPVPFMSLGGVTSNSVKLYWLNSGSMHASSVYAIDVNGIKGEKLAACTRKPCDRICVNTM